MKTTVTLIAFLAGLLVIGACTTLPPSASSSTEASQGPGIPGDDSAPVNASGTASTTVTLLPTMMPTITVTATVTGTPTITATVTVTITASPTMTPVVPPATPAPTDTPVPEPTDTPTPAPPPTSTPTATATEGPPPTATPLPNAVFVRDHNSVRRGSEMHVVGEVTNGSGNPVYNVVVSAAFFDTAGNLIGATETQAFLPQTMPTQNNPFKLILSNAPASVSSYELALRWDDFTTLGLDRITIVSEDAGTDPTVTIQGELRNDGFSPMSDVAVAASFYDAAGHVLDTYPGAVTGAPIAPGASASYSVETGRADLEFDHFLVQAQGVLGR